jgi:voltage-gated potassium channel
MALAAALSTVLGRAHYESVVLVYFVALAAILVLSWRAFDRSSVAASTLFALTSSGLLLAYATLGALYLGDEFKPPIGDLVSALYFGLVTMTTVGYGDIVPVSAEARLFTVSIIILGVAIFAGSLTAVITPLVTNGLRRIVSNQDRRMHRANHFVVVGSTALAVNTVRELRGRGRPVTRVLKEAPAEGEQPDPETLVGDPSDPSTLSKVHADKAEAVLAMTADDSLNAFVVLAAREVGARRIIAAVNEAHHLDRIALVQPDVVIAPQVLGGELTAMMLSGEEITPDFLMRKVFREPPHAARPAS